jgi:hypothetical protein
MHRVRPPQTPQKLVPVLSVDETRRLPDACAGRSFVDLRDQAIIRLFYNSGGRLSEVGNLMLDDVDLHGRRCDSTARGQGSAGTHRVQDRPGSQPVTCGRGRTAGEPSCRTCGWPSAVADAWSRTASCANRATVTGLGFSLVPEISYDRRTAAGAQAGAWRCPGSRTAMSSSNGSRPSAGSTTCPGTTPRCRALV